jgi:hypothetical protein
VGFAARLLALAGQRAPGVRATAAASANDTSAISAISALIALTSSLAASVRRRSQAPMSWARRRIERPRSRILVRAASPSPCKTATNATMRTTPRAIRLLSVG